MNEFNTMAAEFDVMVDKLDEELATPLLADSMEDVDAAIQLFDNETRATMNEITEKYTAIDSVARGLIDSEEPLAQEAFARYNLTTLYSKWQLIDRRTDEREMGLKAEDNGYWARHEHGAHTFTKSYAAPHHSLIRPPSPTRSHTAGNN